jgi:hypothetical protein
MKSFFLKLKLLVVLFLVSFLQMQSQCPGGVAPTTITFDTVGTGTGNDSYFFSLPKFDPSLGTLSAVTITSHVQVNYIYSIGNTRITSALYRTRISRTDDIASPALDPAAISAANQTALLTTVVPGNTTVQIGPSVMTYNVSDIVNDGRIVNFMGAGNVDFAYDNTSFVAFSGPSGSNVDFTQLNDTLHFSVAYTYCTASALHLNPFNFTVVKKTESSCQLNWQQSDEEHNRRYTIQLSRDGKEFTDLTEMAASHRGNYNYLFNYQKGAYKQLFFRLKQDGYDNTAIVYSDIRIINIENKSGTAMRVYPTNPTHKFELVFNKPEDRKITLYSMTGQKIWSNVYRQTAAISIEIPAALQRGMYIVAAVNLNTNQTEVSKIVVQ